MWGCYSERAALADRLTTVRDGPIQEDFDRRFP